MGSTQTKVAQRVLKYFFSRATQVLVLITMLERCEFREQNPVLAQLGIILGDQGTGGVVDVAQLGAVRDCIQMRYLPPSAREVLICVFERLNKIFPLRRGRFASYSLKYSSIL